MHPREVDRAGTAEAPPLTPPARSPAARALLFLPALLSLALVVSYGVDVPAGDDWDTPGRALERSVEGRLELSDLLRTHNDSRPVFPRLVFFALARAFGWHPKLQMLLSWCCTLVCAWAILRFVPSRADSGGYRASAAALLISALLFSAAHHVNQLWGVQLIVFVPATCLAACLWLGARGRRHAAIFLGCAALCVASTYSYANGMLCWVLGCPTPWLWLRRRVRLGPVLAVRDLGRWTAAYACIAALAIGLYFWDYEGRSLQPGLAFLRREPFDVLAFYLAWIGAPLTSFGPGIGWARAAGALELLACGLALAWLGQRAWRRDLLAAGVAYPWLVWLAYGLVSGLVTALGRSSHGPEVALGARYFTFSLSATIGLLGLVHSLSWAAGQRPARAARLLSETVLVAAAVLALLGWWAGARKMPVHEDWQRQNAITLRFVDRIPDDPLVTRVYPRPDVVRRRASVLAAHGVLPFEAVGLWLHEALATPDPGGAGFFEIARRPPRQLTFSGLARIPDSDRPADAVLVCADRRSQPPRILTALAPRAGRGGFGFSDTLRFTEEVKRGRFSLFAVDLRARRLFPLRRGWEHPR